MPHYLRFARSLALLGGLGACGARQTAAPEPTPTASDAPNRNGGVAAQPPVAEPPIAVAHPCDCSCYGGDTQVACTQVGSFDECCGAVIIEGPLPPPDLPV